MYKIAVFVSGRGSNLKAIINSIAQTEIKIEIVCVVSDKIECPAFEIAENYRIPTYSVSQNEGKDSVVYSELVSILKKMGTDLIVLAGFLKKIPDILIENFEKKIINIHPALLPSFGGKGMYGLNVHKAVFEKSAQVSGATVHFVDKIYDNGKIIAQECVDISDANSPEEIAEKVLKVEHSLLPKVIIKFSDNKVIEKNNRIYLL
ncbi:MAG: phosphoribosylglycinamide formyltransferase [Bacteroidetes bacterium]|nr:phosphoribosylglycinamide formyltransferase [Bacteroidota bacterium]MBU1116297.1 phosphoribosylglycinamide formyltransferase [Bacteroidota bacterium]MBU1797314.1 phosphoribosylglycinamide formyltransferase [Bacteroidota bacterium]